MSRKRQDQVIASTAYPDFLGERFIFEFESEDAARALFNCTPKEVLAILNRWNFRAAVARFAGQEKVFDYETVKLMASAEPLNLEPLVTLVFADCSLPATVLRAAFTQMELGGRWGIVRLDAEQRQVIMASGMQSVLLAGVDINETTNWRRPDFWYPPDLAEFNRDWRQQLSEGSTMERRYRIRKPGTQDPWEWYTSRYSLLHAEDGVNYHLGVFVGRG